MTFRLAHVSDLHLTGHESDSDFLDGLFASFREYDVDHVLVTGDVSENGESAAFRILDETRRASGFGPARSTVIPGNHDLRGRSAFMRRFGKEVFERRSLGSGEVCLVTIDSTGHQLTWANNPRGWLEDRDLARLGVQLRGKRAPITLVALHHHVVDVPDEGWTETLGRWTPLVGLPPQWGPVERAEELLDVLLKHRVDAVLSGHVHKAYRHVRRRGEHNLRCYVAGST